MSEKIRELVDKFKQHCLEIKSVFNEKLERDCYSNIRYIFVGDNPGDSEKLANEYMVKDENKRSSAGNNAHRFFKWMDIEDNVLILNKSSICTKRTDDLSCNINSSILKKDLEFMAQLIFDIHQAIDDSCVCITGTTGCYDPEDGWLKKTASGDYRANQFLSPFWLSIKNNYCGNTLSDNLFVVKHFAYWKIFDDLVWNDVCNEDGQIVKCNRRVKISELEKYPNSATLKVNLMNALKSLDYKQQLLSCK